MTATLEQPTSSGRRGRLRRRFTVVSAGMLSILMAILGVSFAADSGTSTITVTGTTSAIAVYPVTGAAPLDGPVTLQAGSTSADAVTTWDTANTPAWSVAAGSAGSVPSAGDLAYLDASGSTAATMMVSLFVTNLDQLAGNYSSYNFNLTLWESANGTTGWSSVGTQVLTSDSGALSWVVDVDEDHYAITLDAGGSFYTVSTTGGSLSPSFFIRATQL